jgi:hypothetical protein
MDFFASLAIILSGHPEPEPVPASSTPIDAESIRFGYGGSCVVA